MKPPVVDQTWPEDVRALYRHDMQEIWDRTIAPQVWNQYHNQLRLYLEIAGERPLRVLDVGCAQCTLALMHAERGHTVTATDLRQQFLDYARTRYTHGEIEFVQSNVLEDDMPKNYDLIFANQIVEHLVYPEILVRRLAALLSPGGRLVMTTPNGRYWKNGLPSFSELGDVKNWEHLQHSADGDGHFYAYLPGELVSIFEREGLIEVQSRFFETPFISGHMKLRHLHGFVPTPLLSLADRLALSVPGLNARLSHQLLVTGRVARA
jgi:2-polyprenyl-6-hydroxyphenyl methylase/3-demethylubiquinone-9 3-methyltransferase